jgi:hypothetical protein
MFSSWRANVRKAKQLITDGNLEHAALFSSEHRLSESQPGRIILRKLVRQLVEIADQRQARSDFVSAWRALSCADIVCLESDRDMLSREMNRFVELTIEHANYMLSVGKPQHASSTLAILSDRRILDRRADQIKRVAKVLNNADLLAAQGRMNEAREELTIAAAQRPDLEFITRRLESYGQQATHLDSLQTQLRRAITHSAWNDAHLVSGEMLEIAPNCKLAIDARRRCDQRLFTPGRSLNNRTQPTTFRGGQIPRDHQVARDHQVVGGAGQTKSIEMSEPEIERRCESFLLWIDGVGGYLVCSGSSVMIGQALPESGVDIPMLGDVRRRHAVIRRVGDVDLIEPLADICIEENTVNEPFLLKNGQLIDLGHGVKLTYRRPHSLSATARLDFTSRHRTQPWSDGVLLASDSIVLGRGSQSHVRCQDFLRDVVLYKEKGKWHCRVNGQFFVDGVSVEKRSEITTDSRIYGDGFSVSLETIH